MHQRSLKAPSGLRNGRTFPNSRYRPNQSSGRRGGFQGSYINPTKFVNKATAAADQPIFEPVHKFSDFGFSPELQRNLVNRNYSTPTAIQDGSITAIMEGKDLIGLANTGTGKTAAFVLPIIQQLQHQRHQNRVLIMAPTRELAIQIDDEFRAFAAGLGLYSAMCVGGVAIARQISQLARKPHVIIGTPGRLKDLVNRRALNLTKTDILVLDEADRMLDM
ncbi:MAG TPA: DEAD/DEAH box helicase [Candidatus Saccharimonadia bacterium]